MEKPCQIIDVTGYRCPMPLLKMKQALNSVEIGDTILVKVSDPGSQRDFQAFIQMTPHQMVTEVDDNLFLYWITKKS